MTFLRSFAVYFMTLTAAVLYWTVMLFPALFALCCKPALRRKIYRRLILWSGIVIIRVAWRPFFRIRFEDRSGGKSAPGIIVVNHRAATDAFLVAVMHESGAQTVNGWPMRVPIIGQVARLAGYPDITNVGFDRLAGCVRELISAGDPLISFPEGTRSESKRMNPFHSGVFQLAMEMELPVGMLCIAGNEFMPDRKFLFREFRDVLIRRLPPVTAAEVRDFGSAFALKKEVFRRMEAELVQMDEVLEHV